MLALRVSSRQHGDQLPVALDDLARMLLALVAGDEPLAGLEARRDDGRFGPGQGGSVRSQTTDPLLASC